MTGRSSRHELENFRNMTLREDVRDEFTKDDKIFVWIDWAVLC